MVDGFLALGASFFLSPQHRLRNRVNSTLRSAELVNRKQFYVSISRARHNVTVTNDRARLHLAAGRNLEKSVALERLHVTGRHELALVHDQPRHSRGHSYGMRR